MKTQITKTKDYPESETDVKKVTNAFESFINPFDIERKNEFFCLSFGIPLPQVVAHDLLHADSIGKEAYDKFVKSKKETCRAKRKSFHSPIKIMKRKTFASVNVSMNVKSSTNKMLQVEAQRNVFGQLLMHRNMILIWRKHYPIPLSYIMVNPRRKFNQN